MEQEQEQAIAGRVEHADEAARRDSQETAVEIQLGTEARYWKERRARDAQAWLSEVLYGGVDGVVLVRSLADFVGPVGRFAVEEEKGEEAEVDGEVRDGEEDAKRQRLRDSHSHRHPAAEKKIHVHYALCEPVPQYIKRTIIDASLHSFAREGKKQGRENAKEKQEKEKQSWKGAIGYDREDEEGVVVGAFEGGGADVE
ncbi:uncharacterized protein STEHIDRAFT_116867 [Stereum hirsutum FP-91666 SS1]|uniref:Uncharacterized protein n=1 Tax=Stereum hirsutum (strain FP-91666) TaxID=721885 RepID=R7RVF7_STEHR|nr:uncharacterized protein STEHIDRAFT_116867 [Stereum hirsutum FP-91666 SS1]EIM78959.1 hypothetical protein STEHIDRAFT_116867 [Stereum hirsutum FP-91666 SS1]